MSQLPPDIDKTVARALEDRGANQPCPRCGNTGFKILKGFFKHSVQTEPGIGTILGGPSMTTVVLVCSRCGFIAQHSLEELGLIKQPVRH